MQVKRYINGQAQSSASASNARVALLEDNTNEAQAFIQLAHANGLRTTWHRNGEAFLELMTRESFDLLVLDWNLSDMTGYEVLRRVRANQPSVPVLMLSANTQELDMVRALDGGADDYIVKPWRQHELLARIRRARRAPGASANEQRVVKLHGFAFDLLVKQVHLPNHTTSELTPKEFDVALLLFQHLGQRVSRAHLLESIWNEKHAPQVDSRKLDTTVSRMRNKLNLCIDTGFLLKAEYGIGYRLIRLEHGAGASPGTPDPQT